MRIDWIVAVLTFLMFTAWAFSYYTVLATSKLVSRSEAALQAADSITGYMGTDTISIPATMNASSSAENLTLWAYMDWTGEIKNVTRVSSSRFSNGSLPCMVSGYRVYWKANVTQGMNAFYIEASDPPDPAGCDSYIQLSGMPEPNQTRLWAAEGRRMASASALSAICTGMNSSYAGMKAGIGVTTDFSVLMEMPGGMMTCGIPLPRGGREVFSFPFSIPLTDGGEAKMSVRLW